MTDKPPQRATTRLVLVGLLAMIVAVGVLLQWMNYRIVKAVDEYEHRKFHVSKIRPSRRLWSNVDFVVQKTVVTDGTETAEKASVAAVERSKNQGIQEDLLMLKPEVVKMEDPKPRLSTPTRKGKSRKRPAVIEHVTSAQSPPAVLPAPEPLRKTTVPMADEDAIESTLAPKSPALGEKRILTREKLDIKQPLPHYSKTVSQTAASKMASNDQIVSTSRPVKDDEGSSSTVVKVTALAVKQQPSLSPTKTALQSDTSVKEQVVSTSAPSTAPSGPEVKVSAAEKVTVPTVQQPSSPAPTVSQDAASQPQVAPEISTAKSTSDLSKEDKSPGTAMKLLVASNKPQTLETETGSASSLLNLSHFKWLMNNESLCKVKGKGESENSDQNSASPRLLTVLVHSLRPHFSSRKAIRTSWGSLSSYKNWVIRLSFLLGEARPELKSDATGLRDQKKKLLAEQTKHGDLIMGSFVDSDKNITYKHMMGFKWILDFCQNTNFVIKTNDNIFVDIKKWIEWLELDLKANKIPDFYCKIVKRKTAKDSESTGASSNNGPEQETHPEYCHRWAYGVSVDAVRKLYTAASNAPYSSRDDIFATGVLKERAKQMLSWKPEMRDISTYVSPKLDSSALEKIGGLCKSKSEMKEEWPLHPITYLQQRGSLVEDMQCLWEKSNMKQSNSGESVEKKESSKIENSKTSVPEVKITSEETSNY